MAGINVPGALVLGNLQSTPAVSIGRGGAISIDNSVGPFGSVSLQGALTATFAPNFGTTALTCGAVACGAITSSGPLNLGSGSVACGAITSSGALNLGSNPVTCGALAASGDITSPRYNIEVSLASTAATQSTGNGVATSVAWTTKAAGSGIAFSNPTDVFTIPAAGWYTLTSGVSFGSNATGVRSVWFDINGSGTAFGMITNAAISGDSVRVGTSLQRRLAAGDTVAVRVQQNSGGSLDIGGDATNPTRFEINRVSE